MKIDLSLLLNPPTLGPEIQAKARGLFEQHGIPVTIAQERGWLDFVTAFLHMPQIWHIQEDGWILGGFGTFWPSGKKSALENNVFASKNGLAAYLNPKIFEETLEKAKKEHPKSVSAWLNSWIGEHAILDHYTGNSVNNINPSLFHHGGEPRYFNPTINSTENISLINWTLSRFLDLRPYQRDNVIAGDEEFTTERTDLVKALLSIATDQYEQTFTALKSNLKKEALQAAEAIGSDELSLISWLSLGNTLYRSQALALGASPLEELLYYAQHPIEEECPNTTKEQLRKLEAAIDQGREWMPQAAEMASQDSVLRNHTGHVDPEVFLKGFRRLAKMSPETRPRPGKQIRSFDLRFSRNEILALVVLATLEPCHAPQNDYQWKVFNSISELLFGRMKEKGRQNLHQYPQKLKQFIRKSSTPGFPVSYEQAQEIDVLIGDCSGWMVTAIAMAKGLQSNQGIYHVITDHFTLKNWREASTAIHRHHEQATQRLVLKNAQPHQEQPPQWPAVLPGTFEHEGVTFEALLDPPALLKEGKEMNHCVGGYPASCFNGISRIYRLEHQHTQERATLELQIHSETQAVFCQQLQGKRNKTPHEKMKKATQAFLEYIESTGPYERFPDMPIPLEWQENKVEDPIFYTQVYEWLEQKHPRMLAAINQETLRRAQEGLKPEPCPSPIEP